MRLEFVIPERALVQEEVDEVELPGLEGYFGVLPGHAPLLATLKTGTIWYRRGTERKYLFIAQGFAEVGPDRVAVLARIAERAEDIDAARAEASKRKAEEQLARLAVGDAAAGPARQALERANTRLQLARLARPRV